MFTSTYELECESFCPLGKSFGKKVTKQKEMKFYLTLNFSIKTNSIIILLVILFLLFSSSCWLASINIYDRTLGAACVISPTTL